MVAYNIDDLMFILQQIKIAEAHAAGAELTDLITNPLLPYGLRAVDGSNNNIIPGRETWGAADQDFLRLLTPEYRPQYTPGNPFVVDAQPRVISNLVVDQTINNPAAVIAALQFAGMDPTAARALLDSHVAVVGQARANWELQVSEAASAQTALTTAQTALSDYITANTIPQSTLDTISAYSAALAVAAGASDDATGADNSALAVLTEFTTAGFVANQADVDALTSASTALSNLLTEANDILAALQADPGVNPLDTAAAQALVDAIAAIQTTLSGITIFVGSPVDALDAAGAFDAAAAADALPSQLADLIDQLTTSRTAINPVLVDLVDDVSAAGAAASDEADDVAPALAAYQAAQTNYQTNLKTDLIANGVEFSGNTMVIPNVAPDEGISAPFNSWMTLFGQFFDHGLDLVNKGGNGIVFIPLNPGDPNYVAPTPENPNPNNFMVLTRATQFVDANGVVQHNNQTTPFVDQNQTYTSHPSHQVFLREYELDGTGKPVATGHLLEGSSGGLATWADIKAQAASMLGIQLSDADVLNVPLLRTDAYGKFIPGPNGYAQIITNIGPDMIPNSADDITVEGNPLAPITTAGAVLTDHAFLDDIAHAASPKGDHDGNFMTPNVVLTADIDGVINGDVNKNGVIDGTETVAVEGIDLNQDGDVKDIVTQMSEAQYSALLGGTNVDIDGDNVFNETDLLTSVRESVLGLDLNDDGDTADDLSAVTEKFYDDELLDRHFITGDGRGNENIGLTAVHHVFHSEHNRMAEHTKDQVLSNAIAKFQAATTPAEQSDAISFLNEWLRTDVTTASFADFIANGDTKADLTWDGERIFQAARFGTEMQYQHLVFEEFARKVNPMVDLFVFNPTMDINPAIFAEFAHVVYRFGHSMLTETVDRTGLGGQSGNPNVAGLDDLSLINAFLNPVAFNADGAVSADVGAGAIVRGMMVQRGSAIDEFVVDALRNFLVGLPLDLPALNIARGRDTGIPSLNSTRSQLFEMTKSEWLKPYDSWTDMAQNIKNPASIINFIAAYGTHISITSATTLEEKRAAATLLVLGDYDIDGDGDLETAPSDRVAFLNATGQWAGGNLGGLNDVDLWIGGLAEEILPFGGMLGSTFTAIFEKQLENLQNGDRFYYLSRTQGTHFLQELENNAFSKIIMANTDMSQEGNHAHLPGEIFARVDHILEVDQSLQIGADPVGDDPILNELQPKVDRQSNVTIDGTTYDNYLKFQGGEHVVLGGTNQSDVLIGDLGDDTIWGDGGNDLIIGGHGINRLHGGSGDDIIYGGGDPEFLHGDEGNDAIQGGNGLGDLIFGGSGHDFVVAGIDGKEVFAAEGNDFILGTPDVDFLLGGEGDDWIEGAEGFDTIAGENSQLFFNSTIVGHDVMFSGTNEMDFDSESGDDIMVQGESVMRNEGMFGFDWVSFEEHLNFGANADMRIKIFTTVEADILRNRFDRVEAMSGSKFGDILTGDNRVAPGAIDPADAAAVGAEGVFQNDQLDREGVERVNGLREVLGLTVAELNAFGAKATVFDRGNILLGGDGSDTISGLAGDDIIDGDKHLNVRIAIKDANNNQIGTVEKMQGAVHFYTAAEVAELGPGYAVASPSLLAREGSPLDALVFDRSINPGQLSIVREILNSSDNPQGTSVNGHAGDLDTAVFQGSFAEYTFRDEAGNIIDPQTLTGRGDGVIIVQHTSGDGGTGRITDDGTDRIVNVERLQFSDQSISLVEGLNAAPAGTSILQALVDDAGNPIFQAGMPVRIATNPDGSLAGVVDSDNPGGAITNFTVTWQIETAPDSGAFVDATGFVTTPAGFPLVGIPSADVILALDGERVRAVIRYTDANGVLESLTTQPSGPLAPAFNLTATAGDDTLTGTHRIPDIPQNQGFGVALPQSGNDGTLAAPIDGGLGDDLIFGLSGDDVLSGGAGGQGNEIIDGGTGTDVAVFYGNPNDYFFSLNAEGDLEVIHTATGEEDAVINIETLRFDDNGVITEFSVAAILGGVTLIGDNNGAGPAVDDVLTGTEFGDRIAGLEGDDTLDGLGGDDLIAGGNGDDVIDSGGGNDVVSGGSGTNDIRLRQGDETLLVGLSEIGTDTVRNDGGTERISVGDEVVVNVGAQTVNRVVAAGAISILNATEDAGGNLSLTVNQKQVIITDHFNNAGNAAEFINFNGSTFAGRSLGTGDYAISRTAAAGVNTLLAGSAAGEVLAGNTGDDIFFGGGGVDNLQGNNGNDIFVATVGDGNDIYNGGAGVDTLILANTTAAANVNLAPAIGTATSAQIGTDQLISIENVIGSQGANTITGSNVDNVLVGLGGNDTLTGGGGNDKLDGGTGTDTAVFASAITTAKFALSGSDLLVTTPGDSTDTLLGMEVLRFNGINFNLRQGTSAGEALVGNNQADLLIGFGGADVMLGLGGNDVYVVDDAGDVVSEAGGNGTDTILTSLNTYTLTNAAIENLTFNGTGDFTGTGDNAENTINGGSGNDVLTGGNDSDTLFGNDGDDRFVATSGDGSGDVYNGGAGNDTYDLSGTASVNVTVVNLATGQATGGAAGTDTLISIENVFGSATNNTIIGNTANNVLKGFAGNDTFSYTIGGGADTIDGGLGNDTLNILGTNPTNETLDVLFNGTSITGFEGGTVTGVEVINVNLLGNTDTLSYAGSSAGVNVNLGTNSGSGFNSVLNISNVVGTDQVDTITGNAGANVLTGGGGNDTLNGGGSTDTAAFSGNVSDYSFARVAGNVTVTDQRAGSPDGTDTLISIETLRFGTVNLTLAAGTDPAPAGVDTINAGAGSQLVLGFDGNDELSGGTGADVLVGGAGSDDFNYDDGHTGIGAANRDVILDFTSSDRIDLVAIDAIIGGGVGGANGDTFVLTGNGGTDAFSSLGEIRYQQVDTDGVGGVDSTLVQGNNSGTNANGVDFEILLQGYTGTLTLSNFGL